MRYLILGHKGMLGADMLEAFHSENTIGLSSSDIDITDRNMVLGALADYDPEVVINCAGFTKVDDAEEQEELANEVNGYAIGVLARCCRELGATFVHFSTDYVFDGSKKSGYNEEDAVSPINAYGRSKALGENLLFDEMDSLDESQPTDGKYFLIRTSWLFGKHGKNGNFVDTMLKLAKSKKELKVVDDQFGKPTYTLDLAKQVKWLVESREYPSGVYHITNEDETSWYEFAKHIFKLAKLDINVIPCPTGEYPTPAKRPKYSSLVNNQLPKLRSWKEALKEYMSL